MYAIIKSGSRQYQVQPESVIEVNRLDLEPGADFITEDILLVDDENKGVTVGAPYISGAKVKGKVLNHFRGEKIIVFKFKRRKNYKRTRGHRQEMTRIRIEAIEVGGKTVAAPKTEAKAAPKAAPKTEAKAAPKAAPKTEAKAAPKAEPKDFDMESKGKAAKAFVTESAPAEKKAAAPKKAPAKKVKEEE